LVLLKLLGEELETHLIAPTLGRFLHLVQNRCAPPISPEDLEALVHEGILAVDAQVSCLAKKLD
jgi:hypothetical protein